MNRELARNTGEREYRHRQAQGRTDRRSARASRMRTPMACYDNIFQEYRLQEGRSDRGEASIDAA
ncbi:MAG: hypothetical protein QS721_01055 [Candidatus Endonucleobacter sp. (ex Gigantidas childressi)]|nr:hypothetical protein [Candidatus Endonucleobacter sp. (ex Gigantidas childressi)]